MRFDRTYRMTCLIVLIKPNEIDLSTTSNTLIQRIWRFSRSISLGYSSSACTNINNCSRTNKHTSYFSIVVVVVVVRLLLAIVMSEVPVWSFDLLHFNRQSMAIVRKNNNKRDETNKGKLLNRSFLRCSFDSTNYDNNMTRYDSHTDILNWSRTTIQDRLVDNDTNSVVSCYRSTWQSMRIIHWMLQLELIEPCWDRLRCH
jgi:hypothetical protein